jgi:hypothetical protein
MQFTPINPRRLVAPEATGRLWGPPYLEKVEYGLALPKIGVWNGNYRVKTRQHRRMCCV